MKRKCKPCQELCYEILNYQNKRSEKHLLDNRVFPKVDHSARIVLGQLLN